MNETQVIELFAHMTLIEGMLSIIVTFIFVFVMYKVFRLCYRFFDMFF